MCYIFSSPAVLEFKASLPSAKKSGLTSELRQGFNEVYQNKALILHDALEALERYVQGISDKISDRVKSIQNIIEVLFTFVT